jgi:hypothetical protein
VATHLFDNLIIICSEVWKVHFKEKSYLLLEYWGDLRNKGAKVAANLDPEEFFTFQMQRTNRILPENNGE